jgi:hypothetical protein
LPKVLWEYISNSIDNAKEDVPLTVVVEIDKSKDYVMIADNGLGMSRSDLTHFFTMHGENIHRKKGKKVRGRFGTGKSAAFGIAKKLILETKQRGLINKVSLHIDQIKNANDGEPFFITEILSDQGTTDEDGTIIRIEELLINRLDTETAINYLEKHIARFHIKASVIVNGHVCKYKEPPFIQKFEFSVPENLTTIIGSPTLIVKVAPYSLDVDERGIDIISDGIWHETTLGEVNGKEFADRLFGEVDVPMLEQVNDEIVPFDNTRNNQLNRANPRVVVLIAWISQELDFVRQKIVQAEKDARQTEQAKKLALEANRMANILNTDYLQLLEELDLTRKISGKGSNNTEDKPVVNGEITPGDGSELSSWQRAGYKYGTGNRGETEPGSGDYPRNGPSLIPGNSQGSPKEINGAGRKSRSGAFSIEFRNLTIDQERSKYEPEDHRILINLDHPQVVNAFKEGGSTLDSNHFLAIVYEIATVAYAQTIPFERIHRGEQVDAADALFAVGDTIDRITRKFSEVLHQK